MLGKTETKLCSHIAPAATLDPGGDRRAGLTRPLNRIATTACLVTGLGV